METPVSLFLWNVTRIWGWLLHVRCTFRLDLWSSRGRWRFVVVRGGVLIPSTRGIGIRRNNTSDPAWLCPRYKGTSHPESTSRHWSMNSLLAGAAALGSILVHEIPGVSGLTSSGDAGAAGGEPCRAPQTQGDSRKGCGASVGFAWSNHLVRSGCLRAWCCSLFPNFPNVRGQNSQYHVALLS